MKKFLTLFLVVILALFMFSCGDDSGDTDGGGGGSSTSDQGGNDGGNDNGGGSTEKTKLTINSYMSDPAPKETFNKLIEMYKEDNPNVEVTVNTFAHEDFKTLLRTWLPSKTAPDVVTWFAGERMRAFADMKLLAPLNDVFPNGFDKEFPKAFESACIKDGNVYFVPQSWYWWGVYYRKSVFEENGVTPPKTWDEFLKVCETLKSNGITPITIGTKFLWTTGGWFDYLNMRVNGLKFHEEFTAGDIPYTDDRVKKALSYLGELVEKGYFLDSHSSLSWQEAASRLFNGEAGMYLMGQFIKDSIDDEAIKDDLDFFRFPIIDSSIGLYEDTPIDGFMVPAKAPNKAEAKKFMKFIASTEAQEFFATELGRLAASKNVPAPDAHAKDGLDMILASDGVMQFYDRDTNPEMANAGMNGFVEYMNNPGKLDNILQELERERARIYSE